MKELYQKKHGLLGVPIITGTAGEDGTGGNHVYFGYINEFFDIVDVSADYLVRTATGNDNLRYTGVFDDSGKPVDSIEGRYMDITSDSEFPNRYSISNPDGETTSKEYVKTDVADIGLGRDGKMSPWNLSYDQNRGFMFNSSFYTDDGELWPEFQYNYFDTSVPQDREHRMQLQQIYPYIDFTGIPDSSTEPAMMMPGKYFLTKSVRGVFDLYNVKSDSIVYQFAYTKNTEFYDGSIFRQFFDSSLHSINNPTISEILEIKGPNSPVDYIKLGSAVSENVQIPDKLKDEIKAGDVIYFYTNEEEFADTHEVKYMTVITDALEKCSYQQLIDSASMVNPYTFKFTSDTIADGNDYLYSTTPAVTGYYKETAGQSYDVSAYGRNMVNMLNCLGEDVAFQVGTLSPGSSDNRVSDMLKLISAADGQFEHFFDIVSENVVNGQIDISTGSNTGKKPMLKIANAYFRKNNIGNIETKEAIKPSLLILDNKGNIHTPDESDINVTTGKVSLTSSDYVSGNAKEWMIGAIVQTFSIDGSKNAYDSESHSYSANDGSFKRYEWNQDSDILEFFIEKTFGDKTMHEITIWASANGSYRKTSGTLTAAYNPMTGQYSLSSTEVKSRAVADENQDSVYGSVNERYTFGSHLTESSGSSSENPIASFDVASISSDKCDSIPVIIKIPYAGPSQEYKVFVNTTQITEDVPYGDGNTWCTAKWVDEKVSIETMTRTIILQFTMKSNLPTICGSFDYARDYNASPGTSTIADGCDLFNAILNGQNISTDSRSVNVAVNYEYGGTIYTDYSKVIQPGYKDPRRIPDVKVNLLKDIRSLEDANKSSLGVMANEFQFFVEIGIDEFDKSVWGSFVQEDSITLDMTIKNTPYDKQLADKYSIPNPKDTRTFHVNTVDETTDIPQDGGNYIKFKTCVMAPENGSPYGKTQRELDEYDEEALQYGLIKATDNISVYNETGEHLETGNSVDMGKWSLGDPDERRNGIQDDISIELKGLHFSDTKNGKFRFRVVTEMSNPVFSMLFFRFYVSDLKITYKPLDGEPRNFYVGQKNMKPDTQLYSGDYMFASGTLRAFMCPVTMTAIPYEDKVERVSTAVMMTGSNQQISIKTGAYVPGDVIIDNMTITDNEKVKKFVGQGQSMGWFNFSLKKKYFQDDVMRMKIEPVRPEAMKDIITKYTVIDGNKFNEIASTDNTPGYMTVVYDSEPEVLATAKREDIPSFYYNSILYDAYGYSQKNNRKPVSTEQTGVIDVRDSSLENAVTFWNRWYQDNKTTTETGLFRGVVSAYGNGYEYISSQDGDDLDVVAQKNDVYTIADTRLKSEDTVPYSPDMGYNTTRAASQPDCFVSAPGSDAWFRTLLYQCQWQYPKHYTDNVTSVRYVNMYDIVTPGEYQKDSHLKIPYNVAYSLYPRCAYDTDNDMAIVFMLRCPSVVKENQYKMTKEDLRVYVENYQPLGNEKLFPAD